MGRLDDARLQYEQALDMYESLLTNDLDNTQYQSQVATTRNNIGALLSVMGRLDDAKLQYEQGLDMYKSLLSSDTGNTQYQSQVASTRNNLGLLLSNMGRLDDAKLRYEQSLDMYESLFTNDPGNTQYHSYVAGTRNNLGLLLSDMGRFDDARLRYKQALYMYESLLSSDPDNLQYQSDVAMTRNNIGNLLSNMGRLDDAKLQYEQALNMRESLLSSDPGNTQYQSQVAGTRNNLGALLSRMGRLDDARLRFEQALDMRESLLDSDSGNTQYQSDVAMTHNNLGALLQQENNFSNALDYHNKALKLVSISSNPDLVFRIYLSRGRCYEKIGKLDLAYDDFKESIDWVELIRSQFSREEYKLDILRDKADVYSDMISLLCLKKNDSVRAWEYVGRAKSRTLLDYLRFIELPVPQSIPEDLRSKEKDLLESIRTTDKKARATEMEEQAHKLYNEIKNIESELDELYNQIADFAPEYVDLRRGQPLSIEGIIDLLNKQSKKTAFVEYYTTHEKIFIFVVHSNDKKPIVKIVDVSSEQLIEYVKKYFLEVTDYPYIPEIEETWQELAEYLINPIFEDITDCEILYLIPHGLLHYLPFHALCINGKRLIEFFPIAYSPSLTTIKYTQRKGGLKLNSCLSMGFTPNDNEKELFEGEASMVAKLFKTGFLFKTKLYLGKKVTSQRLIKEAVDKALVHLSCHANFNLEEPLNSGLLLSDGMLTVEDIFNMDIKANLLVLSACQTGINKQKPGDELIGFTRALLYSGIKSIVVSLWSVNAISTLKLMESFYRKIKNENMSIAEALQKAQIEMMQDKQYFHPYYWAPFTIIGD